MSAPERHTPAAQSAPFAGSAAWHALTQGAAWFARPTAGVLALEGDDRVDFLQRMTTNDIAALRPGHAVVTVLTSPTARIVQIFSVLKRSEDLLLLPAPGEAAALERHLRGQIFFMDKVRVRNLGDGYRRLRVAGPQALAAVAAALTLQPPAVDGAWVAHDGLLALTDGRYELPGVELLLAGDDAALAAAGATLSRAGAVQVEDADLLAARRIELGLPAVGAELSADATPLEAGLAWACAENKGCYTGQEIIARQITYDKVMRTLVGLRSKALLPAGAPVLAEGREVGRVTSSALSPTLGGGVALAIVRRSHADTGLALEVAAEGTSVEGASAAGTSAAGTLPARVAPLPFVQP